MSSYSLYLRVTRGARVGVSVVVVVIVIVVVDVEVVDDGVEKLAVDDATVVANAFEAACVVAINTSTLFAEFFDDNGVVVVVVVVGVVVVVVVVVVSNEAIAVLLLPPPVRRRFELCDRRDPNTVISI